MFKIGWISEVSSYKCGEKASIRMCTNSVSQGDLCDSAHEEAGSRNSSNREIFFNNMIKHIWLVPHPQSGATIYAREECRGRSAALSAGDKIAGSWDTYDSGSNQLL